MNQKGITNIILVVVIIILVGVVGYFTLVRKLPPIAQQTRTPAPTLQPLSLLPTTCKDEPEGMPVITSLSGYYGPVGTKLEIRGCNFSGFEGDKNAWIENSQGIKGILYGETGSTSKLLKVTLKSPLCQKDISYSGLPCDASLILTSGIYKIYVAPWGKESNEVSFTINANTITVKVYFAPKGSEQLECNDVVAMERAIPKTTKVATAALEELLKGPTAEEKTKGYFSQIPVGSKLNSLVIVDGEARADFNQATEMGGGSCGQGIVTTQIRKTLLQFPTIKSVKLSVEGESNPYLIFQP